MRASTTRTPIKTLDELMTVARFNPGSENFIEDILRGPSASRNQKFALKPW
jgi:hypothetical protein